MIFLLVGVIAIILGVFLIGFRDAAARHAENQLSLFVSADNRPVYKPWFIVVIGSGMIVVGLYFVIAASVGLAR